MPTVEDALRKIHGMAWGKPWPTGICTIDRDEIFLNETDNGSDNDAMDIDRAGNYLDDSDIPAKETFKCLLNVDLLQAAFDLLPPISGLKAIIILREYEFLRELLERDDIDSKEYHLVTGQPGTGKSVSILHLLLYRLERKLPTAVQFLATGYIFFDGKGGSLRSTTSCASEELPRGCWCLSDGNVYVEYPCQQFMRPRLFTCFVTSPNPKRFKKWRNQAGPKLVITALPRTVEVAAIAKMHGFQPSAAVAVLRKWGPSIRTTLSILRDQDQEYTQIGFATEAARKIWRDHSMDSWCINDEHMIPKGNASSLLFIDPIRLGENPKYGRSRLIIPTPYLSTIFDSQCQSLSLEAMMTLYELFSMHPTLRGPAGWLHEKNMHLSMATPTKYFKISNLDGRVIYMCSANVRIGTLTSLQTAGSAGQSFYWLPFVANFEGVDGVLVNGNKIFGLQGTIAATHDGPHEGLKKIWTTIGAEAAQRFEWHFVIVTDDESLAGRYMSDLGAELNGFTLGRRRLKVSVWVCVLKRDGSGVGLTSGCIVS